MDLGRPFCFPTQPIGNRGTGKPARFDQGRQSVRTVTASLIPVFPSSAMYPDDEWSTSLFGGRFAWNCQVKGLPGIFSLRIGQISKDFDVDALRNLSSRAKNKCKKEKTDRGFVQLVTIPLKVPHDLKVCYFSVVESLESWVMISIIRAKSNFSSSLLGKSGHLGILSKIF